MRRWLLLLAGLAMVLATVAVACAGGSESPAGSVTTDLGTLGGKESGASAINESGQVVGWSLTGSGDERAYVWEDGKMHDLGTLPKGQRSYAEDINERGQIIGWSFKRNGNERAFVWEHGKMTDLGTLGGTNTHAVAINDRGQIIGQSETKSGYTHAFLWQKGKMIDLGSLNRRHQGQVCPSGSQYEESNAAAINERGQIVGWAKTDDQDMNGCLGQHAFLWEDGKMRDLGTLPGRENPNYPKASYAEDINARGWIVGGSGMGYGPQHAVLWRGGKMVDLGPVGSEALAINNRGQVLIRGEFEGPVLWEKGRIVVIYTRGTHFNADIINERGQLVGSGLVGGGSLHALLWQDGKLTDVGTLRGGETSVPEALNESSQIVGQSAIEKDSEGRCEGACSHAVLWTLKRN